ncbi:formate dehydrogenase [Rhodovulum strictum]|uniref:Formate dehydrogenase n=1 Tax=Rhodovulum strictum TaxID=58314 RepID=A0A844BLT9_9RHOB|nr:formate dehydrogenase [Rhodovulum strictum]MRH21972.1 formate dehydrogenase [Rhodovulum strictum]
MARDDAGRGNRGQTAVGQTAADETGIGRRGFFGMAAGVAAGGALGMGGARPAAARQVGEERTRARYRETEHILTYYRTNRYTRTEG